MDIYVSRFCADVYTMSLFLSIVLGGKYYRYNLIRGKSSVVDPDPV